MKIIGLTGGIASGKTTVANYLKALGAVVIDADAVARQVVRPGEPAWHEIREVFGGGVFLADGTLDRAGMGSLVFANPVARECLNQIIHPRVIETFRREINEKAGQGVAAVVLDVPLLLETGMDQLVDEVWVVAVDEPTQIARVQIRDNLDAPAAKARIGAQMPLAHKLARADRVIDATQNLPAMLGQVRRFWEEAVGCNGG
ncbi:MAG: dephospho-CoA kinase [Heliobacteriaceae bacterium]|nr:dephospho-CoA kinase [Heliobacteriaceae bacterium]MDD4587820.1 dephospho-CoA kinase [Heliobacteriaceae bacterium]